MIAADVTYYSYCTWSTTIQSGRASCLDETFASWFSQHVPEGYGTFEQISSVCIECTQSHGMFYVSMYIFVPQVIIYV